jgi:predicted ATP-grasp superfamily ATP-dependent carboligase
VRRQSELNRTAVAFAHKKIEVSTQRGHGANDEGAIAGHGVDDRQDVHRRSKGTSIPRRLLRHRTITTTPAKRTMPWTHSSGPAGPAAARGRVIVSGGNYPGPLAAVRGLRSAGYEPWVVVPNPKTYAARSRAAAGVIVLPESSQDPGRFVEGIRAEAERSECRALIAGTERDLLTLAHRREALGALSAGIPELETVLRTTNKSTVYRLAAQVGLSVPKTIELTSRATAPATDLELPLIVKPERSVLESPPENIARRAVRITSRQELQRVCAMLGGDRWLAQPCIPGHLGAISGVAWNGQLLCAVHQVAERTWPVATGISAYARTVAPNADLEHGVARLIERLGWSGIFQVQFIYSRDGAYLIDLNPRVYGSISLAIAAGLNLPAIWAGVLMGAAVRPGPYEVGVRYRNEDRDARALLRLAFIDGSLSVLRGFIPRRHTVHSVLSLADPLPFLSSLARLRGLWRRNYPRPRIRRGAVRSRRYRG